MQHPTQTSLVASKLHYKWFGMHFHLVFVCVCQINGPLKNLQQRKMDTVRAQVFAEHAGLKNQRFSFFICFFLFFYLIILSWALLI